MTYLIIHLSAGQAVFARFREKRKQLFFIETFRQPLEKGNYFPARFSEFTGHVGQDEQIILSLPPSLLFMRPINISLQDRRKIREILPLEMKGETAVDDQELIFEGFPLDNNKTLAIWARKKDLIKTIQGMAKQGLEPRVLSASLFHWNTLLPLECKNETVALTDGESLAIYKNGLPLFFRHLSQEDIITETVRTLTALELGQGVKMDRIFLHGKAPSQIFPSLFPESFKGISVSPLPVSGELAEAFSTDTAAALDLAGSYALARVCSREEPVDFRRGDLVYTAGLARTRKKLRFSLILAVFLAVLLFAETGFRYLSVKADLDSLNTSIGSLYREIFPSRKNPVDEVAEIRSEIKRLSGTGAVTAILPILKKLAELKGEEVIGIYEAEIEGKQVRLKGEARSIEGINAFKTRTASLFTKAEVGETRSRSDGNVSFVFRGTVKEGQQ